MNSEIKTCVICGKSNELIGEFCSGECYTRYAFQVIEDLFARRAELPDECNNILFHIGWHLRNSFQEIEKFTKEVLHNPSYTFRWADKVLLASHKFEIYRSLVYQIGRLSVIDRGNLLQSMSAVIDEQQAKLDRASFIEYSTSPLSNLTRLKEGEAAVQIISDLRPYVKKLNE